MDIFPNQILSTQEIKKCILLCSSLPLPWSNDVTCADYKKLRTALYRHVVIFKLTFTTTAQAICKLFTQNNRF